MGNCCGGRKSNVQWEVTYADGTKTRVPTAAAAQQALTADGRPGGSYKAVTG